jgi:hypothetical protein
MAAGARVLPGSSSARNRLVGYGTILRVNQNAIGTGWLEDGPL